MIKVQRNSLRSISVIATIFITSPSTPFLFSQNEFFNCNPKPLNAYAQSHNKSFPHNSSQLLRYWFILRTCLYFYIYRAYCVCHCVGGFMCPFVAKRKSFFFLFHQQKKEKFFTVEWKICEIYKLQLTRCAINPTKLTTMTTFWGFLLLEIFLHTKKESSSIAKLTHSDSFENWINIFPSTTSSSSTIES